MPIVLPPPTTGPPGAPPSNALCVDGSFNGFRWSLTDQTAHAYLLTQDGLEDLPPLRRTDAPRGQAVGWFSGPAFADARTVTLQFLLRGFDDGTLQTNIATFLAATVPQDAPLPLSLLCSTRVLFAKVNKRTNPYDRERFQGFPRPTVEFLCPDPRLYSATVNLLRGGLATVSGGLTFPATMPATFPGGAPGAPLQATNAGDTDAGCVAVISGPVDFPKLTNGRTGESILLNLSLASSDTLTIDTDQRTVLLNGSASRRAALDPSSRWWQLKPGANPILYTANTTAVGSTVLLSWRSAWI
jgi:hypothetical protein